MLSRLQLDKAQLDVVKADAEIRRFVVAAAGQGKTEVLVSRILELEEQGLNLSDEILVLSFSRAAVEAVRSRTSAASIRNVGILTFDAFAARILIDEGVEPEAGFDARIRQATELLRGEEIPQVVEPLRHVLIDEAQDLVGDRADLVLALLDALEPDSGFTVLGDPLQGIYDFQLEESKAKITSIELIHEIIDRFGAGKITLQNHYRAATEQMKGLVPVAEEIRALKKTEENSAKAHRSLDDFIPEQIGTDFLSESGALEPLEDDTTVLLASTNFEVLIASEILWDNKIEHIVRRRAQEMNLAPWVYQALGNLPARTYTFDEIISRLRTINGIDPDIVWRQLKRTEGNLFIPDVLDLAKLARRLSSGVVPLSLTVNDSHRLTLSTIHRSKGLEFSNVIYLPPASGAPASECNWDTLRQKYVAVSRAREQVIKSSFPRGTTLRSRYSPKTGKSVELRFKGKGRLVPSRLEFGNDDIDDLTPYYHAEFSANRVVQVLQRPDLIGLPITGYLDPNSTQDSGVVRYILKTTEGIPIGRTSVGFGYDLKHTFCWPGAKSWEWPIAFEGTRITSVEAAAGNPEETAAVGLAPSGLWLVPRLTGLIRPLWKQV